mgnify:CR=1 FL=1|tara:strand:- start:332 stop:1129 length:798 start_codon:yes stop_codon:yes gene_type:complete
MLNIFKRWNNFINEGVAQKYKFDTAVDVITDEALTALKKGIDNSLNGGDRIEFRFVDGESSNGRILPQEILNFVKKIEGVVRFMDSIDTPQESSVVGSYQESKKHMRLFINVPSTFRVQDIRPSELVPKIKSTLRHEFEHTLDSLRGLEKKAHGLGYGSLEEYYNYFTSPHEVNAYVVGFSKRSKMTERPWAELKDNFLIWLKSDLTKKTNAEKTWDRLNLKTTGHDKASVEDVEDFVREVDFLMTSRHKERYGRKNQILSLDDH